MKIGFFTDSYSSTITHGVDVSIETYKKTLEKMGHQVYIYAPENPKLKDKNPSIFRFKSIRILKDPEIRHAFNFLPVGHTLKEIKEFKLDIAHAHTPFSLGLLAKDISKKQSIPLVYTYHTHYPEYAKVYLREKILAPKLAKKYNSWFFNFPNIIIAPSQKIKNDIQSYEIKKSTDIYILPTGINLNIFKKSLKNRVNLRKELEINPETKVLISVGRIGKEKNSEFLIKTFAMVLKKKSDMVLLMVGDGHSLKELKKIAQKLKIDKSIIFTGKVPYERISYFYQASDLFIFSSLTETQGIVILEAMACGLPVVALKDDAFAQTKINNQSGFLIEKQSMKMFTKKIIEILDNPLLYRKFSNSAIKTASNFSEEKMAKKLIEIYKDQKTLKRN